MATEKKSPLRFVAGAMFVLRLILWIVPVKDYFSYLTAWNYIFPIVLVIMAIALFTGKYKAIAIAAALMLLSNIRYLIVQFQSIGRDESIYYIASALLGIATYAMALIAAVKCSKQSKALMGTAAALDFVSLLLETVVVYLAVYYYTPSFGSLLMALPYCLALLFTGLAIGNGAPHAKAAPQSAAPAASSADRLAQLSKLKELLDMGAISQEEFDEKKKNLLGL